MRIVVNNIAANKGGAMTVLKDFYACVCENDKENQWIFLLADKYFEETENVKIITLPEIKKNPFKKILFDFITGKKYINNLKPDVVFSMQNIMTFGVKAPQIVYLHQPLPFQKQKKFSFFKSSERNLAVKQYIVGAIIKKSVKKADKIIVQTKWMQESVCNKCNVNKEKVVNILPNAKNIAKKTNNYDAFDNTKFFYPTSQVLYKNNELVFTVSNMLNTENIKHHVELTLNEDKSRFSVNCIGRIAYEEVVEKYNTSTLIFPSYIETFGYPLAEARQAGTIILASDTDFSRELLCGYENAYLFNPFKPEELASLMKKVISREIERKETESFLEPLQDNWKNIMNEVIALAE